ncbi:MAG: transketolase [Oligoflexia bacterium]|nr:transketolase [Oligoflexia bacterium]
MSNFVAMRDSFLERLHESMKEYKNSVFLCADFGSPVVDRIRRDFPDRCINVGIAEQNLINVGTGLALEGYSVFLYAIAPFITMRCYEQIRVNIAILQEVRKMNITLIGVGAGCSYVVSGPTHQCFEDLSVMRTLPNIEVISPSDHHLSAAVVDYALKDLGGCGARYLRLDAQLQNEIYTKECATSVLQNGLCEIIKGSDLCIVSTGYMTHQALKVAAEFNRDGSKVGVIDFVKFLNFNTSELLSVLKRYRKIITLEEGFKGKGGLDNLIQDFVFEHHLSREHDLASMGIPPRYGFQLGSREDIHTAYGIGRDQIAQKVKMLL